MATHSSTLAWKIPWTEEPGRLQSIGSQRVGHDWAASLMDQKEIEFGLQTLWFHHRPSENVKFPFPGGEGVPPPHKWEQYCNNTERCQNLFQRNKAPAPRKLSIDVAHWAGQTQYSQWKKSAVFTGWDTLTSHLVHNYRGIRPGSGQRARMGGIDLSSPQGGFHFHFLPKEVKTKNHANERDEDATRLMQLPISSLAFLSDLAVWRHWDVS